MAPNIHNNSFEEDNRKLLQIFNENEENQYQHSKLFPGQAAEKSRNERYNNLLRFEALPNWTIARYNKIKRLQNQEIAIAAQLIKFCKTCADRETCSFVHGISLASFEQAEKNNDLEARKEDDFFNGCKNSKQMKLWCVQQYTKDQKQNKFADESNWNKISLDIEKERLGYPTEY